MVYAEARVVDNGTITQTLVRTNWPQTGSKLISTLDVNLVTGTPSMTVKVFRVDPGGKAKLGAVLSHSGVQATGVVDLYATEPSTAGSFFTGLFRTEYIFSGPGS